MNYTYLILLFALFNDAFSINNSRQFNTFEKLGLKLIIFKRKTCPRFKKYVKDTCDNLYDKFLLIYADSVIKYESMSYEDKQIIEFIMSCVF